MNRRQRDKNRRTAKQLAWSKPCPRCGKPGFHYYADPQSLEDMLLGVPQAGVWICGNDSTITAVSSDKPAESLAKARVLFLDNSET